MMRCLLVLTVLYSYSAVVAFGQPSTGQRSNPYELTATEQAYLDQVLTAWERESAKINTFSCPFTRFVYNAFSPTPQIAFSIEQGEVSYQKPDKGSFKINTVKQWRATPVAPGQAPPPGAKPRGQHKLMDPEKDGVVGDHWVSDGKYIYQYRPQAKELAVTPIPPDMQGEQIVNGPFPFLFGAKKDDLKRRYWLRVHPNPDTSVIHLVAKPKTQADAVNYKAVELQLDRRTLLPTAMQVHDPGPQGGREVFSFEPGKAKINVRVSPLWQALFQSPRTPWGWKRVVAPSGQNAAATAQKPRNSQPRR